MNDDFCLDVIPGYDPFADSEGYYFYEQSAVSAIEWYEDHITHVKGDFDGKPYILEPYERCMVACIFGFLDEKTKLRRYTEVFLYIPRKNSKSTFTAGIALLMLVHDGESKPECIGAAKSRKQAGLIFKMAKSMAVANEALRAVTKISRDSITCPENGGDYQCCSREASTTFGENPQFCIVDELHAQTDRQLVDALETGQVGRSQPLFFCATTADYSRESICNEKLAYAKGVRDGKIPDPNFLPVIYEAPKDADWKSEEVWKNVNPSWGKGVKIRQFKRAFNKAMNEPSFVDTFKRLHLNIQTDSANAWLQTDEWKDCPAFNLAELKGRKCYGGLDLSSTKDMSCFCLYFPDNNAVLPFFWVPESVCIKKKDRSGRNRQFYREWEKKGFLTVTNGDTIEYAFIKQKIIDLNNEYQFECVGYDQWQASSFVQDLEENNGIKMIQYPQSYAHMNQPCKEFEKMVIDKDLRHNNNPILRWMAGNVVAKSNPQGYIMLDKPKSTDKIDGIVAAVMALGCCLANEGAEISAYRSEGFIFV